MEKDSIVFNKNQLSNDFNALLEDAEALLKATANTGGDKLTAVRAKADASFNIAKASLARAQDTVLIQTKIAVKATDLYVHKNPWQAAGFAAGVGVLVGLLFGRRQSNPLNKKVLMALLSGLIYI